MVLLAKALSGGHVPVGALLTRKNIFDKIFNQMDRAARTARPLRRTISRWPPASPRRGDQGRNLIEKAAKRGAELQMALTRLVPARVLKEVRGKGLMLGVEFGPLKSPRPRPSWNVLETANKGPFCHHHRAAVQGSQDPDLSPATAATPSRRCRR
jgi:ornithine--oxo-acid transaminase